MISLRHVVYSTIVFAKEKVLDIQCDILKKVLVCVITPPTSQQMIGHQMITYVNDLTSGYDLRDYLSR